jgi:ParB-like chromosome segregation protein Spo0J
MHVRNRIRELRLVRADQLRPNPRNWRKHPTAQQDVLRGVLAEIGYAQALLARERDDGSLELIDGHLRAETTPHDEVPVLVLDVDEREAAQLLATLDPLVGLAERDDAAWEALRSEVSFTSPAVQEMLADVAAPETERHEVGDDHEVPPRDRYQVLVECRDEAEQRALYEQLHAAGHDVRLLVL